MTSVMKLSFDKGRFNACEEHLADYFVEARRVLVRDLADHAPINYMRVFCVTLHIYSTIPAGWSFDILSTGAHLRLTWK